MGREEFDQRPLHLGTILGLRAFHVGADSRLYGPARGTLFDKGENLATCLRRKSEPVSVSIGQVITSSIRFEGFVKKGTSEVVDRKDVPAEAELGMTRMLSHLTQFMSGDGLVHAAQSLGVKVSYDRVKPPPPSSEAPEPEEHLVATRDCSCGYYAYYDIERPHRDGYDPFNAGTCIRAIIEGYGLVTVGTRGFRAQKARLVALIGQRSEEKFARISWTQDNGIKRVEYEQGIPAELESYYNVPVYPTVEAAVSEYPLVAPEEPADA